MKTAKPGTTRTESPRIPRWLKISYTTFMAVLIPVYTVNYGVTNFLWFCDVALIVTLIGLWREDRLLISMASVAIILPQLLWVIDFAYGLATGGGTLISLAAYMFDSDLNIRLRAISLFHGWLPFLLIYAVYRLGYDRRALKFQIVLAAVVLLASFLSVEMPLDAPGGITRETHPAGNINKVLGWNDDSLPQKTMHPFVWLGVLMAAYPLCLYIPSHLALARFVPARTPDEEGLRELSPALAN